MRLVKRIRTAAVTLALGLPIAGCAAHADRAAVAPTGAVYISADVAATCDAGPRDRFLFDEATAQKDPAECHAVPIDDDAVLDIPEGAPPEKRARAIQRYLADQ